MPVAPAGDGARLTGRIGGPQICHALLVLIIASAITDLAFAFDSILAIFGLTREPCLVFTANAFALLALRHLHFLIGGPLGRVPHLRWPVRHPRFIGMKRTTEALMESGVHRIGAVPVPHIGTGLSLAIIAAVITTGAPGQQFPTRWPAAASYAQVDKHALRLRRAPDSGGRAADRLTAGGFLKSGPGAS